MASFLLNKIPMNRPLFLIIPFLLWTLAGCGSGDNSPDTSGAPQTNTPLAESMNPALPGPPANLKAVAGNQKATLTWDPVDGATAYNLYFFDSPGADPAAGEKIPAVYSPYAHEGLSGKKTLYYRVAAVTSEGESPPSQEVSITPAQIIMDKLTDEEITDDGWLIILGNVRNFGKTAACDITIIATIKLLTQQKEVVRYWGLTGETMTRNGLSDSACLRPGEAGAFQIYTGFPASIVRGDYTIEIDAATDEIKEPPIRTSRLIVTDVPFDREVPHIGDQSSEYGELLAQNVKWEAATWNSEDISGNLLGTIGNNSDTTAYMVIANLITYNSQGDVIGIYPGITTLPDSTAGQETCIPPGAEASFSIMPWRSVPPIPTPDTPLFIDSYEILISYLAEGDLVDFKQSERCRVGASN